MGNALVSIVMFGWIPVVLGLFSVLPPRRAVLAAFLLAWLFLPMAGFKLAEGIPLYDKMSATCAGVMLGILLFDMRRLASFDFGWIDLPMLLWCLSPFASSLANGLGIYDGLAAAFSNTITWGLPYCIGRLYFRDLQSVRELAVALFIGGLVYVPLCLIEIRLSPQLHNWVYGFAQHDFAQTIRFGGWRPMVFMQHGLMVGMWMCMTALIGVWLWYTRVLTMLWRLPMQWLVLPLLVTAILCKSTGAILLLALGMAILFATAQLRQKALIWGLVAIAPLYMAARGSGLWDGSQLIQTTQDINQQRSDSLQFRINNENILAARAREQPIFGWGGWSRNRVIDKYGHDLSVTDGLWIIIFGCNGVLGLAAWTAAMLLPAGLFLRRTPISSWLDPHSSPAIVLAVISILYVLDCIPNGMVNPIFTLCSGAIATLAVTTAPQQARQAVSSSFVVRNFARPQGQS